MSRIYLKCSVKANSRVIERRKYHSMVCCPNGTQESLQRFAGTNLVAGSWHLPHSLKTCVQRNTATDTVPLSDIPFWAHLFKEVFFLLEECEGIGQEKMDSKDSKSPRTPLLCVLAKWLSHIWLFATPGTLAHQTPLLWDYPGKNTGVGVHLLLQGIYRGVKSQANIPTQAHF